MRGFIPNPAQQVPFEIKNFEKIEPQMLASRYGFSIGKVISYAIPKTFLPSDAISTMDVESEYTTWMGTPVGNRYIILYDKNGDEDKNVVLYSPVITVRYSKNIVRTPITGFDYTIKEVVSGNDYQLDIVGIFATQNAWEYPIQQTGELNDVLKSYSDIQIQNEYLSDVYNITKIIPESWEFAFHPTLTNLILYKLTCYGE